MNNNGQEFTIEVSSDLDYEKMVVNLYFLQDHVAVLSCEADPKNISIEIMDSISERTIWRFSVPLFIAALTRGMKKLQEVNE